MPQTTKQEFKLLEIKLCNIFNYRNDNVVDFRTESDGNVFLFDIKNGGGKTSLFLAIKWGFYGFGNNVHYVKDGIELKASDFINQDMARQGRFYVDITFEYDGEEMKLHRVCTNIDKNLTEVTLGIGDKLIYGDSAEKRIEQIIPPDYGDFFMFNGEVLNDMAINQKNKEKVEGVLKLLGLMQLDRLRTILESVKTGIETEHYGDISKKNNLSNVEAQVRDKSRDLERCQADLSENETKLKECFDSIRRLENRRNELSDIEKLNTKLTEMSARESMLTGFIRETTSRIDKDRSNAFLLFVHDDLQGLIEKLEEERRCCIRKRELETNKGAKYIHIQKSIIANHLAQCPVCSSILTEDALSKLLETTNQSDNASLEYDESIKQEQYIKDQLSVLKPCYSDEPQSLNDLCTELFGYREELTSIKKDILATTDLLSESEIDAVKDIARELSKVYRKKQDLELQIRKQKMLINAGNNALSNLNAQLKNQVNLSERERMLANRVDYVNTLLRRINTVIRDAKNRKRADILARASDVFMNITNKPNVYSGLAYDDQNSFSMHIVRKDGQEVKHPSSGEKHVLAISFLVSLSMNTERTSPMMMDTPLSRLDVEHKKNIGTMLSKLHNQVLFLAQPGELDEQTRESLKPAVAKYFESRPTIDNTASIVEVKE